MSIAVEGYGSYISRSSNGVSYTRMAEVTKITAPSTKVKSLDVSNLDSPSNRHEFIPGMVDEGEISLELNFTAAEFTTLRATLPLSGPYTAGTSGLPYWQVTLTTGDTFTCQGFITSLEAQAPVDDKLSATCTIKLSGVGTWS